MVKEKDMDLILAQAMVDAMLLETVAIEGEECEESAEFWNGGEWEPIDRALEEE
jgi:hypothetical protein